MRIFKHLEIGPFYVVNVHSTDENVLKWIIAEAKRIVPDCEIKTFTSFDSLFRVHIQKLRGKDEEINWWIMQQLGQEGWEPFAIHTGGDDNLFVTYHFRLAIDIEK